MTFAEAAAAAGHSHLVPAAIILDQLGGRMFKLMTGAHGIICCGQSASEPHPWLRLTIGAHEAGWRQLQVTLLSCDLYRMEFVRSAEQFAGDDRRVFDLVEASQLQAVFTEVTGMYTSL